MNAKCEIEDTFMRSISSCHYTCITNKKEASSFYNFEFRIPNSEFKKPTGSQRVEHD